MFTYRLVIYLPINQVFVKAENFEDCVQDALEECFDCGYIVFTNSRMGLTEDDDIELYGLYKKNGIDYFMKYVSYDINELDALRAIDGRHIQYIIPINIDVRGLLEGV